MLLLCHPRLTTTNLSYGFPLLETWATTLCGTTRTFLHTLSSFLACARLRGIYNVCACIWLAIAISYVNRGLFWYYRSWRVCWRCNIFVVVEPWIAMVGLLGTVVESWNPARLFETPWPSHPFGHGDGAQCCQALWGMFPIFLQHSLWAWLSCQLLGTQPRGRTCWLES